MNMRIVKRTYLNETDDSGNPLVRFTIQKKGFILFWIWFDASCTSFDMYPPEDTFDTFDTFEEAYANLKFWSDDRWKKTEQVVYPL